MSSTGNSGCSGCLGVVALLVLIGFGPPGWMILFLIFIFAIAFSNNSASQNTASGSKSLGEKNVQPLLSKPENNSSGVSSSVLPEGSKMLLPPLPPPLAIETDTELDALLQDAKESLRRHDKELE